ncbi:hypothetical protein BpHYR1_004776 [Brachionus plicatilis]|uniref:Uncharacterized protein n=1 Tax=Brachionus plicatilis TaxID=10195 RepID=A0A3M7SZK1_BRAPC|nr:hypothetical protein BpHYR1_004776 [Brachionus plicatilis]
MIKRIPERKKAKRLLELEVKFGIYFWKISHVQETIDWIWALVLESLTRVYGSADLTSGFLKGYGAIRISTSWSEICWNLENLTFRSKVTVVQSQDNLIIWVSAK